MGKSYKRVTVGRSGVGKEIRGFPVYFPKQPITFVVSEADIRAGREYVSDARCGLVPQDAVCDNCAISIAARRQLGIPEAIIGAAHVYLAHPHDSGIEVPGYAGRWALFSYETTEEAKRIIKANDVEGATRLVPGTLVTVNPLRFSSTAEEKARRNAQNPKRRYRGMKERQPGKTHVLERGVRNYSGRVWATSHRKGQ